MPIYELRCADCGRLSSLFTRSINASFEQRCKHCGSERVNRPPAKVAYHRSEQSILEQYGNPAIDAGPDAYKDPRQIGRWVEKRFDDMGMDLPQEARTMIDAARQGEFPEPVKDL
ncbi:MAG: FmdB family zinc ribbon protein [Dehalococcoidia bacterium]